MANQLVRTFTEGARLIHSGKAFVERQQSSSGKRDGEIIGLRKATVWEGIKISLYSGKQKLAYQRAQAQALQQLVRKERGEVFVIKKTPPVVSVDETDNTTSVIARGKTHVLGQYRAYPKQDALLDGPTLMYFLKNNLLPIGRESGAIEQEPLALTKMSIPPKGKKTKNFTKAEQAWTKFKNWVPANGSKLANGYAWRYGSNANAAPAVRRHLNATLATANSPTEVSRVPLGKKTADGVQGAIADGWTPIRELITWKDSKNPGQVANIKRENGHFSTIILRGEEIVPLEFPQKYTQLIERFDAKGVSTFTDTKEWTFAYQEEIDAKSNIAWYKTTVNGQEHFDSFSLEQMVACPHNLLLEHGDTGPLAGCVTVWKLMPDPKLKDANGLPKNRWYTTTYDSAGQPVQDKGAPGVDGSHSMVRESKAYRKCASPFLFTNHQMRTFTKLAHIEEHIEAQQAQIERAQDASEDVSEIEPIFPGKSLAAGQSLLVRFAPLADMLQIDERFAPIYMEDDGVLAALIEKGHALFSKGPVKEKKVAQMHYRNFESENIDRLVTLIAVLKEERALLDEKGGYGFGSLNKKDTDHLAFLNRAIPYMQAIQKNRVDNQKRDRNPFRDNADKGMGKLLKPSLFGNAAAKAAVERFGGVNAAVSKFKPTKYQDEDWKELVEESYSYDRSEANLTALCKEIAGRPELIELLSDHANTPPEGAQRLLQTDASGNLVRKPSPEQSIHSSIMTLHTDTKILQKDVARYRNTITAIVKTLRSHSQIPLKLEDAKGYCRDLETALASYSAHLEHLQVLNKLFTERVEEYRGQTDTEPGLIANNAGHIRLDPDLDLSTHITRNWKRYVIGAQILQAFKNDLYNIVPIIGTKPGEEPAPVALAPVAEQDEEEFEAHFNGEVAGTLVPPTAPTAPSVSGDSGLGASRATSVANIATEIATDGTVGVDETDGPELPPRTRGPLPTLPTLQVVRPISTVSSNIYEHMASVESEGNDDEFGEYVGPAELDSIRTDILSQKSPEPSRPVSAALTDSDEFSLADSEYGAHILSGARPLFLNDIGLLNAADKSGELGNEEAYSHSPSLEDI